MVRAVDFNGEAPPWPRDQRVDDAASVADRLPRLHSKAFVKRLQIAVPDSMLTPLPVTSAAQLAGVGAAEQAVRAVDFDGEAAPLAT